MKKFTLFVFASLCWTSIFAEEYLIDVQFINQSNESIDFSLVIANGTYEEHISNKSKRIIFGKQVQRDLTTNPYFLPGQKSISKIYIAEDLEHDWMGFSVKKTDGTEWGLKNKFFPTYRPTPHYCDLYSDDSPTLLIYKGDELYIQPKNSSTCSFGISSGYDTEIDAVFDTSPKKLISSNLSVNASNKILNNQILKSSYSEVPDSAADSENGRVNYQIELQKNPHLQEELDDIYFQTTGIDRSKLKKS